jgi:predicted lipopolysaccharide heptosyltransferase III
MLVKGTNTLPKKIQNILLVQLGDIGDVVLTTPTIRALCENFPDSRLVVAIRKKAEGLLEACPWISEEISIDNRKRPLGQEIRHQIHFFSKLRGYRFDLAIELRTGSRGAILSYLSGAQCRIGRYSDHKSLWRNRLFTHLVRPENEWTQYAAKHALNILAPFELSTKERSPTLLVSPEKKKRAAAILENEGVSSEKPLVAVQPFAFWKYKEWGTNHFIDLIDFIGAEYGFHIIITGSPDERERAEEIRKRSRANVFNLAGRTSIGELPGILKACDLLITGDTGPLHIAAAVGTPTISLFGPSSSLIWAPRGEIHHVIRKDWACVPCMEKGCQGSESSRCLDELTVQELKDVIIDRLSKIRSRNDFIT